MFILFLSKESFNPFSFIIIYSDFVILWLKNLTGLLIVELVLQDMPETWQMTFQDPATNVMEGISDLHHDVTFFIVLISAFAFWMIFITVYTYRFNSYLQPY
jgi:heme/copper-type cytochrome/quinol oxidase subunit 2